MKTYKPVWRASTVEDLLKEVLGDLLEAPFVDTGHWQAKRDTPMTKTREILNAVMEIPISCSSGAWASFMRPNLPWAETHFLERVSGIPYNPPPSHIDWPFNREGNKDHMDGQAFSHSYPERLWPRYATSYATNAYVTAGSEGRQGIRYRYGDLDDLVTLLIREPYTRQAYVPLWFPEDLAAANQDQRVPCTLGYSFILRDDRLHCFYPMRSLDVLRYFQDDAYMAGRLCQWIIQQCRKRLMEDGSSVWHEVMPGTLTLHAVSLHCFEGDIPLIQHKLNKREKKARAAS